MAKVEIKANVKSNGSHHCSKWNGSSFLERRRIGNVECRVCRAERVLGVATTWRPHDVECGNSITWMEFGDVESHFVHEACDVAFIALAHVERWHFPGQLGQRLR